NPLCRPGWPQLRSMCFHFPSAEMIGVGPHPHCVCCVHLHSHSAFLLHGPVLQCLLLDPTAQCLRHSTWLSFIFLFFFGFSRQGFSV
ncbi:mCG140060, partial [Mus musculus]